METRSRCSNTSRVLTARSRQSTCCSKKKKINFNLQTPMPAAATKSIERANTVSRESVPKAQWFEFEEAATLPSPALLIYRDRVEENLRRMVATAGGAERLRPHIKTHKMRELLELQLG